MKKTIMLCAIGLLGLTACAQEEPTDKSDAETSHFEVRKSEKEWRAQLSPQAYDVLRKKGTERAFSGKYNDFHEDGIFTCAGCGNPLFDSSTKFKSGTGWPSFYTVIGDTNVVEVPDKSMGMNRVEVVCGRCGGHLGHVFEDGPPPTGLRYCVNSAALDFEPTE